MGSQVRAEPRAHTHPQSQPPHWTARCTRPRQRAQPSIHPWRHAPTWACAMSPPAGGRADEGRPPVGQGQRRSLGRQRPQTHQLWRVPSRPTPAAFSSCTGGKVPEPRERTMHQIRFRPAPWPRPMYMQKSAFNCFKSCADSQAPFSGIADARRRGRPRAPHADLAILRWLPPSSPRTQGGGGLSKSTLLIIYLAFWGP